MSNIVVYLVLLTINGHTEVVGEYIFEQSCDAHVIAAERLFPDGDAECVPVTLSADRPKARP